MTVGPTALPQARSRRAILSFPTGMPMDCLTLLLRPVAVRGGGVGRQECGFHQESQKGLAGRVPPGAVGSEWGGVGTMQMSGEWRTRPGADPSFTERPPGKGLTSTGSGANCHAQTQTLAFSSCVSLNEPQVPLQKREVMTVCGGLCWG